MGGRPKNCAAFRSRIARAERVPDLERVVVRVQGVHRALEREAAELRLAGRAEDADRHAVLRERRDEVELADDEREEVGRHPRRRHERHRLGAVVGLGGRRGPR